MAITTNIMLEAARGKFGKQIVIKQYGGKTVLSRKPDMSQRVLSPKQLAATRLMKRANAYAKKILYTPELKAVEMLRLNVPANKLYVTLVKEFMVNKGKLKK